MNPLQMIIPNPELEVTVGNDTILLDPIEAEWEITSYMTEFADVEDLAERDKKICQRMQEWLNSLEGTTRRWTPAETFAFMLQLPAAIEEYKKKLIGLPSLLTSTDTNSLLTPLQSPLDAFNSPGSSEIKSPPPQSPEPAQNNPNLHPIGSET